MSEILQIFQKSPPPPRIQSQFNWSMDSDFHSPDVNDNFQCSEFAENPFTNFSSSSVDELSKMTGIVGQNQSLKKRKLEFDEVEVDSQKQSAKDDDKKSTAKTDYIRVRARRGQATDNHSIAERARREKIKKKMQYLQDLVPGCNKLTNKAAILDQIITYVQCLQMEVQFLTKQLATSTTTL